ncbi:MAG: formate--tetrahydrofolate ligase [Acidimicrobiales bacterium]
MKGRRARIRPPHPLPVGTGFGRQDHRTASEIYGADEFDLSTVARRKLERYEQNGFSRLGVCIAKTHLSMSSDPSLPGAPACSRLPVREIRASVEPRVHLRRVR